MAAPGARVLELDLLRGLAVLLMIETHSLVLLEPGSRSGRLFAWVVRLDGLVAPAFLLAAGCSLALVLRRPGRGPGRTGRRLLEVLAAATVVNLAWFPILEAPRYLLRLDILHCVGLSLLLLWPVAAALRDRPRALRWTGVGVGAALFALAPLVERVGGWPSLVLNNRPGLLDATTGSAFPLLPWAGYAFVGASLGTHGASEEAGPARRAWRLGLMAAGAAVWAFQDHLNLAYRPHQFWVTNPASAAQRAVLVLLALAGLERLVARVQGSPRWVRSLAWLSGASLPAYVFHELLLYERHVGVFARNFQDRAGPALYLALLAALVACTVLATLAWRALLAALARVASGPRAGWPRSAW